jgi:hypothetical protein
VRFIIEHCIDAQRAKREKTPLSAGWTNSGTCLGSSRAQLKEHSRRAEKPDDLLGKNRTRALYKQCPREENKERVVAGNPLWPDNRHFI